MSLTKHIPNTITSLNLLCGILGGVFAVQGRMDVAFPLMLLGMVFDFCDGLAARLLGAYSPIGKELDSLADMVSFGVLPALMLCFTMQARGCQGWICWTPLILALLSAVRLAKFNVDTRQSHDFLGVPTPTSALICGSLAYFIWTAPDSFLGRWAGSCWFLPLLALLLGLLLVSEIPMFGMKVEKGRKLLDAKRIVFLALAAAALLTTFLTGFNWSLGLLSVFIIYLVENLILFAINRSK